MFVSGSAVHSLSIHLGRAYERDFPTEMVTVLIWDHTSFLLDNLGAAWLQVSNIIFSAPTPSTTQTLEAPLLGYFYNILSVLYFKPD